jgi:hypothetical protein
MEVPPWLTTLFGQVVAPGIFSAEVTDWIEGSAAPPLVAICAGSMTCPPGGMSNLDTVGDGAAAVDALGLLSPEGSGAHAASVATASTTDMEHKRFMEHLLVGGRCIRAMRAEHKPTAAECRGPKKTNRIN